MTTTYRWYLPKVPATTHSRNPITNEACGGRLVPKGVWRKPKGPRDPWMMCDRCGLEGYLAAPQDAPQSKETV